jgi:hypothetical protein
MRLKNIALAVAAMSVVAAQPALAATRSAGAVPQRGVSEAQSTIARSASETEGDHLAGLPYWALLLLLAGLSLPVVFLSDSPN